MDHTEQDATEQDASERGASDLDLTPAGSEPEAPGAPDRKGGRPRALVVAVSLAAVFALATAVLAVMVTGGGDDSRLEGLRSTAGRFGEALVTYDYHDPKAHRDAVLDFATGSFREEYETAFDQGLGQIITEVKATSRGYVKDIYLSAVDEERAQAIVVVDIEHEGSSGPNTLYDVYFRLTLVEVGGRWKVDQVTDLNFDKGAAAPVTTDTTASTATSVP